MQWKHCECGTGAYYRVHRSWWMRVLFGNRRLYQCGHCNAFLFLHPRDVSLAAQLGMQSPARNGNLPVA